MESKIPVIIRAIHSLSVKHVINVCLLVKDVDPDNMEALIKTSIVSVMDQYADAIGEKRVVLAEEILELMRKIEEFEHDKK